MAGDNVGAPEIKPPEEKALDHNPLDAKIGKADLLHIRMGIDYVASRVKANNPKETKELNDVLKNIDDTISKMIECYDYYIRKEDAIAKEERRKRQ